MANSVLENEVSASMRILFLLLAGLVAATSAVAEPLPRSVLIVSQWDAGLPFFTDFDIAFDVTLHAAAKEPVSVYSEAMDLSRFSEVKFQDNFRRYLAEKYRDKNLGVIVAVGPRALEFILRARLEVLSTVPVVFSVVDEATISRAPRTMTILSLVRPLLRHADHFRC